MKCVSLKTIHFCMLEVSNCTTIYTDVYIDLQTIAGNYLSGPIAFCQLGTELLRVFVMPYP